MPQKKNWLGKQQNYDKSTGEYTSGPKGAIPADGDGDGKVNEATATEETKGTEESKGTKEINTERRKFNIGSEKRLDASYPPDKKAYDNLKKIADKLNELKRDDDVSIRIGDTYEDYGADMPWTTILMKDKKAFFNEEGQVLNPKDWIDIANAETDEELDQVFDNIINDKYFDRDAFNGAKKNGEPTKADTGYNDVMNYYTNAEKGIDFNNQDEVDEYLSSIEGDLEDTQKELASASDEDRPYLESQAKANQEYLNNFKSKYGKGEVNETPVEEPKADVETSGSTESTDKYDGAVDSFLKNHLAEYGLENGEGEDFDFEKNNLKDLFGKVHEEVLKTNPNASIEDTINHLWDYMAETGDSDYLVKQVGKPGGAEEILDEADKRNGGNERYVRKLEKTGGMEEVADYLQSDLGYDFYSADELEESGRKIPKEARGKYIYIDDTGEEFIIDNIDDVVDIFYK